MKKVLPPLRLPAVVLESVRVSHNQQLVKLAAARDRAPSRHQSRLPQILHNSQLLETARLAARIVVGAAMYETSTSTTTCLGVHRPARHLVAPTLRQPFLFLPHHHRRAVKYRALFLLGHPPARTILSRNRLSQHRLPHHPSKQMSPHVRQGSSLLSIRHQLVRHQLRIYRRRRSRLFLRRCDPLILHQETEYVSSRIRVPAILLEIVDHSVRLEKQCKDHVQTSRQSRP